jgi:hypothetical protein
MAENYIESGKRSRRALSADASSMDELNTKMKSLKMTFELVSLFVMVANTKSWDPEQKITMGDAEQGATYWSIVGLLCDAVNSGSVELEGLSKMDAEASTEKPSSLQRVIDLNSSISTRIAQALTDGGKEPFDYKSWFCVSRTGASSVAPRRNGSSDSPTHDSTA